MSDDEARENFKTVRLSDTEMEIIQEAARQTTRPPNPSKVIRDGALDHAREILERDSETVSYERPDPPDAEPEPGATERWLEEQREKDEELKGKLKGLEEKHPDVFGGRDREEK